MSCRFLDLFFFLRQLRRRAQEATLASSCTLSLLWPISANFSVLIPSCFFFICSDWRYGFQD